MTGAGSRLAVARLVTSFSINHTASMYSPARMVTRV